MRDPEAYRELVLSLVEQVPPGQATTYGDLAEMVGEGGPRQVGQVMATVGGGVPWWRVVRADGRPVRGLEQEALERLSADGTPLRGGRVDLTRARFRPAAETGVPVRTRQDHIPHLGFTSGDDL